MADRVLAEPDFELVDIDAGHDAVVTEPQLPAGTLLQLTSSALPQVPMLGPRPSTTASTRLRRG